MGVIQKELQRLKDQQEKGIRDIDTDAFKKFVTNRAIVEKPAKPVGIQTITSSKKTWGSNDPSAPMYFPLVLENLVEQ